MVFLAAHVGVIVVVVRECLANMPPPHVGLRPARVAARIVPSSPEADIRCLLLLQNLRV